MQPRNSLAVLGIHEELDEIYLKAQPYVSSQHLGFYFEGTKLGSGFHLSFHPAS